MPEQAPEHPQPIVTVDVVILTLRQEALHVALSRREQAPHAGDWTLPGGWVHPEEERWHRRECLGKTRGHANP